MAVPKRRLAFASGVVGAAVLGLVIGSTPARGVVSYRGNTWYADGSPLAREGPSGSPISAYATGAVPNHSYKLYFTPFVPERDHELCGYSLTPVNPAVRVANVRGFIPVTNGTITGPPGLYSVCFVDIAVPTDPAHPEGYYSSTIYQSFRIT